MWIQCLARVACRNLLLHNLSCMMCSFHEADRSFRHLGGGGAGQSHRLTLENEGGHAMCDTFEALSVFCFIRILFSSMYRTRFTNAFRYTLLGATTKWCKISQRWHEWVSSAAPNTVSEEVYHSSPNKSSSFSSSCKGLNNFYSTTLVGVRDILMFSMQ